MHSSQYLYMYLHEYNDACTCRFGHMPCLVCIWQFLRCRLFTEALEVSRYKATTCLHSFSDMMYLWSWNGFIDDQGYFKAKYFSCIYIFCWNDSFFPVDVVHSILLNDDFILDSYAQKFSRLDYNYCKGHLCIICVERKQTAHQFLFFS